MPEHHYLLAIKSDPGVLLQRTWKLFTGPLVSIKSIRDRTRGKADGGAKSIIGRYDHKSEVQKFSNMEFAQELLRARYEVLLDDSCWC